MKTEQTITIKWAAKVDPSNYPAALSYLGLTYDEKKRIPAVERLKTCPITTFKAKDIFRASGLSLLGVSNFHVEKDRTRITAGKELSPILLVRDPSNGKVIIADGYHRLCAVYSLSEDADIPCQITSI